MEEVAAFIRAKFEEDTPLSLNELNQTAGGLNKNQKEDIVLSVFTAGLYCGIAPLVTFIQEKTGPFAHLGMKKPDDGYFCNNN